MDVCFSFDCTFNDDGGSNCKSKYMYPETTSSKPATKPVTTLPTSHQTAAPSEPVSASTTGSTSHPTAGPSGPVFTSSTTVPKPSPSKLSTTSVIPKTSPSPRLSSYKPTVPSKSTFSGPVVTTPHLVTTHMTVTTTSNNSQVPRSVTSHPVVDSAEGKSIYIPCSVVAFVIVFLLVSIGIIRRHRTHTKSSEEDRHHLHPDCAAIIEVPPFYAPNERQVFVQPSSLSSNGDPMFFDVPLADDKSDTDEFEVERHDMIGFNSGDSDDLETSPKVDVEDVIFDARNVRQKQRKRGGNNSGVV